MTEAKSPAKLAGRRVLVVEDEYFLADDLAKALSDEGIEVAGPVGTLDEAVLLVERQSIDCAIVDINLRGEIAFPLADRLSESGVPFVIATGYAHSVIPERFGSVPHVEKPFQPRRVIAVLEQAIGQPLSGADS